MDTDRETDALVWQLHRQLNDLRPRAGRAGAALTTQPSLERVKRGRTKQQATESGSREHSRKRRSSDGGGEQQHTSAQRVKKEPIETSSSGDERHAHPSQHRQRQERQLQEPQQQQNNQQQQQQEYKKERERVKGSPAELSDHQERPNKRSRQQQLETIDFKQLPAAAQAAVVASKEARQRATAAAQDADAPSKGDRTVKLFLAGMRWGVSLPCSALRSRQELARSINDAFVGEILSVGRGDDLNVVFVTTDGDAEEVPALQGGVGRRRASASSSKWRRLVGKAARVYVRWHDNAGPGDGGGAAAAHQAAGTAVKAVKAMPHDELD